jgi:hypothetical protein
MDSGASFSVMKDKNMDILRDDKAHLSDEYLSELDFADQSTFSAKGREKLDIFSTSLDFILLDIAFSLVSVSHLIKATDYLVVFGSRGGFIW